MNISTITKKEKKVPPYEENHYQFEIKQVFFIWRICIVKKLTPNLPRIGSERSIYIIRQLDPKFSPVIKSKHSMN